MDNAWIKIYNHEVTIENVELLHDPSFSDHAGIYFDLSFKSKAEKEYSVMVKEKLSQRELRAMLSKLPQVKRAVQWEGTNAFANELRTENFFKYRSIRVEEALPSY